MFTETTLINADLYISIGIILSLVLIISFFIANGRTKRNGTNTTKRVAHALLAATIIAIASTAAFGIMVEYQGNRYEYVYAATIECGLTQGTVYLPVSNNTKLQEKVSIVSGDGRISLADTEHGRAIKLIFNGTVTIVGRIVTDKWLNDWEPTMMDSKQDAWVKLDSPYIYNGTIVLDFKLENNNLPGHDAGYYLKSPLKSGWELYELDHFNE
jgi:hypothetical protein